MLKENNSVKDYVAAMPEAYYERWESLYKAERRAWREGKWFAWRRASKRLIDHENTHGNPSANTGED